MPRADLKDPDLYLNGVPYALFAELRKAAPLHWNPESDGAGFWSVLGYEDITAISKDPKTFSSAYANGGHRIFNENERGVGDLGSSAIGVPFISTDPPLHRAYRSTVLPGLKLTRVREMTERLKARIAGLLDKVMDLSGEFDFIEHLAAPFPLLTLAELFGVPASDIDKLYAWSNALVGEDDPTLRISPAQMAETLGEMLGYASYLFDLRRAAPQDDILSLLANGTLAGEPISRADFLGTFILLLVGGNETTRNSIAHGMVAFTENPDQWRLLGQQPALMPLAVREILRYASPVFHMRRTAMRDTEINAQPIKQGDKLVLWYAAGNRDEAVFSDPQRFDITRNQRLHLAFGTGEHTCVGNRLAEVQIALMFEALLTRLPTLRITGAGRRLRSNFINGYLQLPAARA
jgi:linalool 8-monooxygenase